MANPTASFDGNDFASLVPGLIVIGTNPYRMPNRDLTVQKIASTNRSVLSTAEYSDAKLNVQVEIGQNSRPLLDDSVDTLKGILQGIEKPLISTHGSGTRKWTATLSNIAVSDVQGGHGTYDIEFTTADPVGYDISSVQLFSDDVTGSTSTWNFNIGGSAPDQGPITTITFISATGLTNKTVTIGNPATSQSVAITRTWLGTEVLVVNSQTGEVTINGSPVAFSGAVPKWKRGPGSMSYSDNFTTRRRQAASIHYRGWV